MYCKHCGKELNENAAVCLNCGVRVGDGSKFCQQCGFEHDPLAVVCIKCGIELKKFNNSKSSKIMSFGEAIKTCFTKYATIKGRASRAEYWWFSLLSYVNNLHLYIIFNNDSWDDSQYAPITIISIVLGIILFLPQLSVTVRRLHDIGFSGAYLFIGLIPIVGPILSIVMLCKKGDEGENEYGANPYSE